MPREQVRIDDNDPRVQYQGAWSIDPLPGAEQTSAHGSTSPGASATLTFTGSSVQVFGILDPNTGLSGAMFTLGDVTKTYRAPKNIERRAYSVLFAKFEALQLPILGSSQNLFISTLNGSTPSTFWLDYFIVESLEPPSPPQSSDSTSVTFTQSITTISTLSSASVPNTPPISHTLASSSLTSSDLTVVPPIATSIPSGDGTTPHSHRVTTLPPGGPGETETVLSNPGTQITSITTTDGSVPSSDPSGDAKENLAQSGGHPNTAAIVGGVFACLLVIACVVIYALVRRNRRSRRDSDIIYPSDNYLAWNGNDMVAGEAWAGSKYPASPGMTEFSSPNIIPDAPPTQHGLTPMASNPFMERVHTKYS